MAGGDHIIDNDNMFCAEITRYTEGISYIYASLFCMQSRLCGGCAYPSADLCVDREFQLFCDGAGQFQSLVKAPFTQSCGMQWHRDKQLRLHRLCKPAGHERAKQAGVSQFSVKLELGQQMINRILVV